MSGDVTLCFYLVIGACVAVALWISDVDSLRSRRLFTALTTLLFWPLYLPLLLVSKNPQSPDAQASTNIRHQSPLPLDEMSNAIAQVERELDNAQHSLNDWVGTAPAEKVDRFTELRSAWHIQAERIRELDKLLLEGTVDAAYSAIQPPANAEGEPDSSSTRLISTSEKLRQEHLTQLKLVRQQHHDNLLATLAWVRQLIAMVHLARYSGAPATRAVELTQQIAGAADGLSNRAK